MKKIIGILICITLFSTIATATINEGEPKINIESVNIEDISWEISVNGGLLGNIHENYDGKISTLEVGLSETIFSDGLIFGFGKMSIIISCKIAGGKTYRLLSDGF